MRKINVTAAVTKIENYQTKIQEMLEKIKSSLNVDAPKKKTRKPKKVVRNMSPLKGAKKIKKVVPEKTTRSSNKAKKEAKAHRDFSKLADAHHGHEEEIQEGQQTRQV